MIYDDDVDDEFEQQDIGNDEDYTQEVQDIYNDVKKIQKHAGEVKSGSSLGSEAAGTTR